MRFVIRYELIFVGVVFCCCRASGVVALPKNIDDFSSDSFLTLSYSPKIPTARLMELRLSPTKQARLESCPAEVTLRLDCLYSLKIDMQLAAIVATSRMHRYASRAQYLPKLCCAQKSSFTNSEVKLKNSFCSLP